MRSKIKVETVSANVTDPRTGASSSATIAFDVSYDSNNPETAQKVAAELANLIVNENQVSRTEKAERASGFLGEEESRLRDHITDLEAKLAAYKERNSGRLPELMNLNLQMLERSQKEVEEAERQINGQEERKIQLESQLALLEPYGGNSPGGRLRDLQSRYLSATAVYSADHPDVIRLRREIGNLKRQTGIADNRGALESEYKSVSDEFAEARKKYAPDHPDVLRLGKTVASLEAKLKASGRGSASAFSIRPDNPAYVTIQSQLDSVVLNLKAAKEQRDRAREKIADYESRVVQTPRVEQEGLALQRDYDSALKKYRELKQNLMGANMAVSLEREQRGERYSVLEHPDRPESPEMPNRRAFLLLGLVLGLGAGVGYASIAEYMDRTVRGVRGLVMITNAPPLAVIPYISNGIDPPRLTHG